MKDVLQFEGSDTTMLSNEINAGNKNLSLKALNE
jgi:hypothetical protein